RSRLVVLRGLRHQARTRDTGNRSPSAFAVFGPVGGRSRSAAREVSRGNAESRRSYSVVPLLRLRGFLSSRSQGPELRRRPGRRCTSARELSGTSRILRRLPLVESVRHTAPQGRSPFACRGDHSTPNA